MVDTSAAFAVLMREPTSDEIQRVLHDATRRLMSAASVAELGVVLSRRFATSRSDGAERFVDGAGITIVPVDARHALRAIEAHHAFGHGRHPAKLNYGDCFTYATAAIAGLPILCVGDDFAKTDVEVVSLTP